MGEEKGKCGPSIHGKGGGGKVEVVLVTVQLTLIGGLALKGFADIAVAILDPCVKWLVSE